MRAYNNSKLYIILLPLHVQFTACEKKKKKKNTFRLKQSHILNIKTVVDSIYGYSHRYGFDMALAMARSIQSTPWTLVVARRSFILDNVPEAQNTHLGA